MPFGGVEAKSAEACLHPTNSAGNALSLSSVSKAKMDIGSVTAQNKNVANRLFGSFRWFDGQSGCPSRAISDWPTWMPDLLDQAQGVISDDDPSHDFQHALRVLSLCLRIAR